MLLNQFVLLATGKEKKILVKLLFGDLQLNNLGLAVSLARRGNLPGAEDLVRLQLIYYIYILAILS